MSFYHWESRPDMSNITMMSLGIMDDYGFMSVCIIDTVTTYVAITDPYMQITELNIWVDNQCMEVYLHDFVFMNILLVKMSILSDIGVYTSRKIYLARKVLKCFRQKTPARRRQQFFRDLLCDIDSRPAGVVGPWDKGGIFYKKGLERWKKRQMESDPDVKQLIVDLTFEVSELRKDIEILKKSSSKLDDHIGFIHRVYADVIQSPLDWIRGRTGYLQVESG